MAKAAVVSHGRVGVHKRRSRMSSKRRPSSKSKPRGVQKSIKKKPRAVSESSVGAQSIPPSRSGRSTTSKKRRSLAADQGAERIPLKVLPPRAARAKALKAIKEQAMGLNEQRSDQPKKSSGRRGRVRRSSESEDESFVASSAPISPVDRPSAKPRRTTQRRPTTTRRGRAAVKRSLSRTKKTRATSKPRVPKAKTSKMKRDRSVEKKKMSVQDQLTDQPAAASEQPSASSVGTAQEMSAVTALSPMSNVSKSSGRASSRGRG